MFFGELLSLWKLRRTDEDLTTLLSGQRFCNLLSNAGPVNEARSKTDLNALHLACTIGELEDATSFLESGTNQDGIRPNHQETSLP